MVTINRVYTRKGDAGETRLIGGATVFKDDLRVCTYGTVDELNSVIGIARSLNAEKPASPERDGFDQTLQLIQQRLFDVGSELATQPGYTYPGQVKVTEADVAWLERIIDKLNDQLEPLQSFVLPGGGQLNAFLHLARTICRRAEREVVTLSHKETVSEFVIAYLNRLSDALFVFSRWSANALNEQETLWKPGLIAEDNWP